MWHNPTPYLDTRCQECDDRLVSQRAWNAAGSDERREMKTDGYARQGVGPYCHRCSTRKKRTIAGSTTSSTSRI